jgi:hypothetical protein
MTKVARVIPIKRRALRDSMISTGPMRLAFSKLPRKSSKRANRNNKSAWQTTL